MGAVEHIEAEIQELAPQDLARLREWFIEYDAKIWDRKIEADSKAGRLDSLKAEALADYKSGNAREL